MSKRKQLDMELEFTAKKLKELKEKMDHLSKAKEDFASDSEESDAEVLDFSNKPSDDDSEDKENSKEEPEIKTNAPAEKQEQVEVLEKVLNESIVAALGNDPLASNALSVDIHSNLIKRCSFIASNGLKKEDREELNKKYIIPEELSAPVLNEQIQAKLKEKALKRDGYRLEDQKLAASALTALCAAITMINSQEEEGIDQDAFIERLADATKLIAAIQFSLAESRKAFIIPRFSKSFQEILKKAKQDKFLFGKELATKIKEYKDSERLLKDALGEIQLKTQNNPRNPGNLYRPLGMGTSSNRQGSSTTGALARPKLFFRRSSPATRGRKQGQNLNQRNFNRQQ